MTLSYSLHDSSSRARTYWVLKKYSIRQFIVYEVIICSINSGQNGRRFRFSTNTILQDLYPVHVHHTNQRIKKWSSRTRESITNHDSLSWYLCSAHDLWRIHESSVSDKSLSRTNQFAYLEQIFVEDPWSVSGDVRCRAALSYVLREHVSGRDACIIIAVRISISLLLVRNIFL